MRRPLLLRLLLALTLLAPLPLSLLHALPFLLAPIAPPPEGLRLSYGQVVLPFFARVGGAWQQVNLTCTVTLVVGGRAEYSCPNSYAEVVSPYLEKVNSTFFLGPPSRTGSEGLQGAGGVHWYVAAPGSLPAYFTTRRLITAELQRRVVVLRAFSVAPGDTLLPHLYDWYFDGINDYVLCDCYDALKVTTGLTMAARILVYPDSPTGRAVVHKNPSSYDYHLYLSLAGYSAIQVRNASGSTFWAVMYEDVRGKGWRYWVGTFDGVYLRFYRDGVLRDSRKIGPTTLQVTDTPLIIGHGMAGYAKVSVSHAIILNRALNDTEVSDLYATNVVRNNSDLVFFVDPTWCTGDTCFNLAYPSATCRMYNGVARVPANQTWLWVVKGLRSDSRVGLRFFPPGSVIAFRDANGNPVAVVEADGRDAIEVDLPSGSYTVEAYVPAHSVAVVPHVYDWSSGSSNGYVIAGLLLDGTGKPLTLYRWGAFTAAARLRIDRHTSTSSVTSLGLGTSSPSSGPVLTLTAPGDFSGVWYYASVWNSSGFEAYTVPLPLQSVESQWRWYAVTYVNSTRTLTGLLDSSAVGSATLRGDMYFITDLNPASLPSPYNSQMRRLAVFSNTGPGDYSRGLASFVAVWARALPAGELQQLQGAYAVSGALLELFVDPTMWNGTHYLSLVNGYVARAYSGAARVPAEQVWLWQVSLAGAGEVVLAWIPPGSFARVRGGGTEVAALGRRVGDSRVLSLRAVDGSFSTVRYTVELAWFPTATGDWFSFQPSFGYEAWGRVAAFFHWNGTHALPDLPALLEGHYLMAAVEDPHVPGLVSLWVSSGTCYRVPGADTPIYLLRFAPAPELGEGAAMPKAYVGDADGAVNVTGLREAIVANLSAGAYLRWQDAAGNPWTAPIQPAWGEVYSVGGVGVRRYLFSVSDMTGRGGVVKIMTMDRTVRCSAQMTPGGLTGLSCPLSYGEAYAVVAVWPDGGSRTSMWFTAGGAVTLNVYVSLVAVTLTQPGNLYVFESAAGRVYVSTDGVSWVELKPLTGAVELKEVKATVRVDIDAVVVGERNVTYTDPFGRTRWRIEPQYRYALRAVSTCLLADRPCGPVRVTVYRPDGTYAGELVLEPPPRGTAAQSIDPWPDPAAIVRVTGFSEFGPYRVEAAQPGLATTGQLPYTYDVRPLLALLPVALFVAFGVRVSLRETALGVFAYGFLAAPLSAALGVPIQAAGAILAVCTAVAAILLLLGR